MKEQRWWDDPAQVRRSLALVDGADPALGVSVAVLGYHGIAKAALEPLSKTTLVDVETLARALDNADFGAVVEAVHSATCDALGHDAAVRYANGTVGALTDAAKESAGRLATALVSKGMPWPQAVGRAAEAAGVPLTRLGRYATQVSDLAMPQISVMDHADRVLMEYAAHRGSFESDLVSKGRARARHAMHEWEEEEVKRDEKGRFSVETQMLTDTQKDTRAKDREARRARRAKRAKRAMQKATAIETRALATSDTATGPGRAAAGRSGVLDRANKRTGDDSDATSPLGLPMFSPAQIPTDKLLKNPVTVDEPLFQVRLHFGKEQASVLPQAFGADTELQSLVREIAAYHSPSPQSITILRMAAGHQPVIRRNAVDAEPSRDAPYPGWVSYVVDPQADSYGGLSLFADVQSFNVFGRYTDGDPRVVPVSVFNAERDHIEKARARTRHQSHEWEEEEVKRDTRGRFAVEGQAVDEAEKVKRAKDREARRARRARRVKRAQSTQVRERAGLGLGDTEQATSRGAAMRGQVLNRANQNAERLGHKEVNADTAHLTDSAVTVDSWIDLIDEPLMTGGVPLDLLLDLDWDEQALESLGFKDMLERARADAANPLHPAQEVEAEELRMNLYPLQSDGDAYVLDRVHKLADVILNHSVGGDADQVVAHVGRHMAQAGQLMARPVLHASGSSRHQAVGLDEKDEHGDSRIARAFWNQGILAPGSDAVVLLNERLADRPLQVFPPISGPQEIVFLTSKKARLGLQIIRDLSRPVRENDTADAYRLRSQAVDLIEAYNGTSSPKEPVLEIITTLAEVLKLNIEGMPPDVKSEIGYGALTTHRGEIVRLDGIDIFSIT